MIALSLKSNSEGMEYNQAMAMFTRCAKSMHTNQSVTTFDFYDGSIIQCQYWGDKHPAGFEYTVTVQDQLAMNNRQDEKISMRDVLNDYIKATDALKECSIEHIKLVNVLLNDYLKRGDLENLGELLKGTDLEKAMLDYSVGIALAMNLKEQIKDIDLNSKFMLD